MFATNNAHKLDEARQILADRFDVVSLAEIGCSDDIPETADSLEGNAMIKARWVKDKYGCDCFADDTGLMVDALAGAPGVYSARYAGENCTPADNVAKLLQELKNVSNRNAHFSTVVAYVSNEGAHCFEGRVDGEIATECRGEGGFGYDPVFVASETGKTFAEMSAEDKNAISHRGRAMRKFAQWLPIFIIALISMLAPIAINAAQWRLHPSYDGDMEYIVDAGDYLYFLGAAIEHVPDDDRMGTLFGFLYRYDKKGDEVQFLNATNLLSANVIRAMEYNYSGNYLVVAYDDGDVDIVYDNGKVKNVPGLKIADSSLSKNVNNICIDPTTDLAYLATDFGYVIVDCKKGEVKTSRKFDKKLNGAFAKDGIVYLAADNGFFIGNERANSLSEFSMVAGSGSSKKIVPSADGKIYVARGGYGQYKLCLLEPQGNSYRLRDVSAPEGCTAAHPARDGVLMIQNSGLSLISADAVKKYEFPAELAGAQATLSKSGEVWLSAGRKGIVKMKADNAAPGVATSLTPAANSFMLPASNAFICTSMAWHKDYGMLVRNHGFDSNFGGGGFPFFTTPDLISAYRSMEWEPMSVTYRYPEPGLISDNPSGIAVDPLNPDHVYSGSMRSGLLRLDLKNPQNSLHFSKVNDFQNGYGQPGFVAVVPENNGESGWPQQCAFSVPAFDAAGNMFVLYVNSLSNNGDKMELWIWTPEKRLTTTSASNYKPFHVVKIPTMFPFAHQRVLPLTAPANKGLLLMYSSNLDDPLLVYNYNNTPENTADDKLVRLKDFTDQDGKAEKMQFLPAWIEDPSTGLVWFSTPTGIVTVNPQELIKGNAVMRHIKVPRNDGTNLADYLLSGITVNCIAIDGAGRKWFGTSGAGIICTSADGRTILNSYTSENSSLPSNSVYALCYNPSEGSMMISTDKGLAELFAGVSASGDASDVKVWPNPVRPDYYGEITIEGLPEDAVVKIVDVRGNLVSECGMAQAGMVTWDATNIFHKRVPGGVYFVLASNGPGKDAFANVAKILVVE